MTNPFTTLVPSTCGNCAGCAVEGNPGHDFDQLSGEQFGQQHNCTASPCSNGVHNCWCFDPCPQDPEDGDDAAAAGGEQPLAAAQQNYPEVVTWLARARDGEVDVLRDLSQYLGNRLALDPTGTAIQVAGTCSPDLVVAQVPINRAQREALMELLAHPAP